MPHDRCALDHRSAGLQARPRPVAPAIPIPGRPASWAPFLAAFLAWAALAGAEPPAAPDRAAFLAGVAEELREPVARSLDAAGAHAADLIGAVTRLEGERARHWACWLIAHMADKGHVRFGAGGATEQVPDLAVLPADLLVDDVRLALLARERFPWAAELSDELFGEFVLPYRFTEEPLENWRPALFEEVSAVVAGCGTAEEAVLAVNRWAAGRVKYESRAPQDLGILAVAKAGKGRCEDMSNFVRAALSAVGIPAASVYTPWWPRGDGNHAWNEAWIDGRWRQFMGCEPTAEAPFWDRMKQHTAFAKVFRCGFRRSRGAPEDVTAEYSPVRALELETAARGAPVELCVMNLGAWRGVAAAVADERGRVRFADLGCRAPILYCTSAPGSTPFVLRPGAAEPEFADTTPVRGARATYGRVVLDGVAKDAPHVLLSWIGHWDMVALAPSDDRGSVDFGPLGRPRTLFAVGRRGDQGAVSDLSRPFLIEPDEAGVARPVRY